MFSFIKNFKSARALKRFEAVLHASDVLMGELSQLSDDALAGYHSDLRQAAGVSQAVAGLRPRVFAAVREAIRRTLGMRAYPTQVMAAAALGEGAVVEMGTGEGKTLVAVFAVYEQFCAGRPAHVCTANPFLAQRDAGTMRPVYEALGMTVGVLLDGQDVATRREQYACDVVYGTHLQFAQDFLGDNLVRDPAHFRQRRGLGFCLVDEADAALIDDARSPVVVSAPQPVAPQVYETLDVIARALVRGTDETDVAAHFWVDAKSRQAVLTDTGYLKADELFVAHGLLSPEALTAAHYGNEHQQLLQKLVLALSAYHVLHRDQHYVVQDGSLVLVDEITGRLMPQRRWDSGLQQALQAKEGLPITPLDFVLGQVTLQHFFKRYERLSGMTGTAQHDAAEFKEVYGLPVVVIPPYQPSQRIDEPPRIYRTEAAKLEAVLEDIQACHARGRPILVGTASIEQSETLSARLTELGVAHEVLNARQHQREAMILAKAGRPGAVTVATNMAGRGVDIVLGGLLALDVWEERQALGEGAYAALSFEGRLLLEKHCARVQAERAQQVRALGGLRVVGLERYESRRMDRQLRGRCARQGDPGSTCFYISLEDPLVENFAGERIRSIMKSLKVKPGDELEGLLLQRAIDEAQRQIEGRAADARAQLLRYDAVFADQRDAFYAHRRSALFAEAPEALLEQLLRDELTDLVAQHVSPSEVELGWDLAALDANLQALGLVLDDVEALRQLDAREVAPMVVARAQVQLAERRQGLTPEQRETLARTTLLSALDSNWFAHLAEMEVLRRGIHLRGHAKVDPNHAFKREAFELFARMLQQVNRDALHTALSWRV